MTPVLTALTIAASAVIVLTGLVALARALVKARDAMRDNAAATRANTKALDQLKTSMDGRLTRLEEQVAVLMAGRRR